MTQSSATTNTKDPKRQKAGLKGAAVRRQDGGTASRANCCKGSSLPGKNKERTAVHVAMTEAEENPTLHFRTHNPVVSNQQEQKCTGTGWLIGLAAIAGIVLFVAQNGNASINVPIRAQAKQAQARVSVVALKSEKHASTPPPERPWKPSVPLRCCWRAQRRLQHDWQAPVEDEASQLTSLGYGRQSKAR